MEYFSERLSNSEWRMPHGARAKHVMHSRKSTNIGRYRNQGRKVYAFRMLQGRNPDWVTRSFLAKYDPKTIWLDDLKPAFGEEKFFFEQELEAMFHETVAERELDSFE